MIIGGMRRFFLGELGELISEWYAGHHGWVVYGSMCVVNSLIDYRRILKRWGNLNKWEVKTGKQMQRLIHEDLEPYHEFLLENCIHPASTGNPDWRYWSAKKGLPDYLVRTWVYPNAPKNFEGGYLRLFFVEVKSRKSSLTPDQKRMINILKKRFPVYIFQLDIPENLSFDIQINPV